MKKTVSIKFLEKFFVLWKNIHDMQSEKIKI